MAEATDPQIGRLLKSTYRIERLLGRGGMGAVYEARHTKISKRYAVKLLLPDVGFTPTLRERFFREAEACSRIEHENVVEILDFDETPEGELFMVMEMLVGKDLAARLGETSRVAVDDVIRWFSEICNAVAAAHRLGIVHRDLKPGNVFIQQRGGRELVKVLDFGLAKFRAESGLTTSGAMMGTPCYMAPEQIEGQGEAVGPATDIFALGCILYELVVGRVAFHGKSIAQIAYKIVHGERPRLADGPLQPLQPVIERCLATDPAERFQTVDELRLAFVTAMGEAEVGPETILATIAASDVATLPTMASGPELEATLAASSAPDTTRPEMGVAATVAVSPSAPPTSETTLPPVGPEEPDPDELPDAAMYTTAGRLKKRKWTLLTVLLVLAGGVAALALLQHLRRGRGGKRAPVAQKSALPDWARGLPADVHPDLARAEQPARWMTLTQARWEALATALEKANQPDLGHARLQRLQVRMYLARSRALLLGAKLDRAQELADLARRKAGDAAEPHARLLAGTNAAWIHLYRGRPAEADRVLQGLGSRTDPRLLSLRAAAKLTAGDVSTALSQAREAVKAATPDPTGWLVLSLAADLGGRRLEAERAAARALALAPGHPPARIRMASLLATAPSERTAAIGLCQPRKGDPPLYVRALAACKVRLAVITALDRSDAHTHHAVLARIGERLSDGELVASAPLLLGEPGLPRAAVDRLARLLGARGTGLGSHARLLGAATALQQGHLREASALLAKTAKTAPWRYRTESLLAEIALRAGQRADALRLYDGALRSAGQAGVRPTEGAPPKDPVPGACDQRAPRETDYHVLERRIAQLRRQPGAAAAGAGLRPVLALILRQEPVL